MQSSRDFYLTQFYPFQDRILKLIDGLATDFYLSGGTAASRGYLNHRFSDDLDLFVNDDDRFRVWSVRLIESIEKSEGIRLNILRTDERFVRCNIQALDVQLKVEIINDVPGHVGEVVDHPVLGRLDSAENILANKVTALVDRNEPRSV